MSLTPQQSDRMRRAVDAGEHASRSEIVREALRLRERQEEIRALELERLKRAYAEGMASGEGEEVDPDTFLQELKAERHRRR